MKIELNNDSLFKLALDKAKNAEYYEALCLFTKIGTYEADINRVGCLAMLDETPYAWEAYRLLISKYYDTHNYHYDVSRTGLAAKDIAQHVERTTPNEHKRPSPKKLYAVGDLLGMYESMLDFEGYPALDLNFEDDCLNWEDRYFEDGAFFDVSTQKYRDVLRYKVERAFLDDNKEKFNKYSEILLSLNATDIDTVEAQLAVAFYKKNPVVAARIAHKYSRLKEHTPHGIGNALDCLAMQTELSSADKKALKRMIDAVVACKADICVYDLCEAMQLSLRHFADMDTCLLLAEEIYDRKGYCGIDALKVCACAFFNAGKMDMCHKVAQDILRAIPDDTFAKLLLMLLSNGLPQSCEPCYLDIAARDERYFWVPSACYLAAQLALQNALVDNNLSITEELLPCLDAIANSYKLSVMRGDVDEAHAQVELLHGLCTQATFADDVYFRFASRQLRSFDTDPAFLEALLMGLVQRRIKKDVLVSVRTRFCMLRLSQVTQDDPRFWNALALYATIRVVDDVTELQNWFEKIVAVVDVANDHDGIWGLTYALLVLTGADRNLLANILIDKEDAILKEYGDKTNQHMPTLDEIPSYGEKVRDAMIEQVKQLVPDADSALIDFMIGKFDTNITEDEFVLEPGYVAAAVDEMLMLMDTKYRDLTESIIELLQKESDANNAADEGNEGDNSKADDTDGAHGNDSQAVDEQSDDSTCASKGWKVVHSSDDTQDDNDNE